ncbi:MAG: S8/S53 family peptidase [Bacteroidetes bacterium]|nr:S8/S53 family peptidase [Bacteroidota bacterium]
MANTKKPSPKKTFNGHVDLKGSARKIPAGKNLGTTNLNDVIEVTVRLRRKNSIEEYVKNMQDGKNKILTEQEFEQKFAANEKDIDKIESFAQQNDLTIVDSSAARRSVVLKGTVQHFSKAFGVYLSNYQHDDGKIYRGRMGSIKIPAALEGIIEGVFGLDDRPQAKPMFRMVNNEGHVIQPHAANISYNPNDVAKAYNYPKNVDGTGQCIALIELGGGYRTADMKNYFSHLGLPLPLIKSISVDGAVNSPSTPDSADGEVALDIEVAGAVATGAKIVVYFTPNTDKGFLDAITTALHDQKNKASVISISWGASESQWSEQAMQNFNQTFMSAAALGVTITVAAGDNGSSDGQTDGKAHVDFPASSPYVLACGGTKLEKAKETVWNDGNGWATGGGISDIFAVPDYQKKISLPASVNSKQHKGRGMPDIAANADSATGYNVLVDAQWSVIGGTSAVAPLMAGLIALSNQKLKRPVGFINPKLYAAKSNVFKDITQGNNTTAKAGGYTAKKGWDACTGLGVPLGAVVSVL